MAWLGSSLAGCELLRPRLHCPRLNTGEVIEKINERDCFKCLEAKTLAYPPYISPIRLLPAEG